MNGLKPRAGWNDRPFSCPSSLNASLFFAKCLHEPNEFSAAVLEIVEHVVAASLCKNRRVNFPETFGGLG